MISLNLKPENWENKTIILSSQVKYYNSFYHKSQKVSLYMMIYDSLLVLCLVTQLCLTLCEPMDCSLPGSSVHGNSPGKNTEVGCHALLQGIFQTQGSNLDIPHCRQILYHWATRKTLELFTNLLAFSLLQTYNYNCLIFWFHFCCSVPKSCSAFCNPMDFKVAPASRVLCWDLWPLEERICPGPKTRLDHESFLCNRILLKYKRERENF